MTEKSKQEKKREIKGKKESEKAREKRWQIRSNGNSKSFGEPY